jgi:type II secretion system protein H
MRKEEKAMAPTSAIGNPTGNHKFEIVYLKFEISNLNSGTRLLNCQIAKRKAQIAFTLLELMIVLTLAAIMTAMIIPEMKGTYEDARLRSTGRTLMGAFRLASSRAITVSQTHRVRLDLHAGRYFIEARAREPRMARAFAPIPDMPGSQGELDSRIAIEVRTLEEDARAPNDAGRTEAERSGPSGTQREIITFNPDGTADAVDILLRDREGFELLLRLDRTTARVRVVDKKTE